MNRNIVLRLQLWALRALRRPYFDLPLIAALLLFNALWTCDFV